MDVALKVMRALRGLHPLPVSILVLLDVALKEDGALDEAAYATGFNPCSLGCCSESRDAGTAPQIH